MATVTKNGSLARVDCESALEFLEVLNPVTGLFRQRPSFGVFIFRGQSSADDRLVPAAFRADVQLLSTLGYQSPPFGRIKAQCEAELHTIRRFFDIASRHGIRIPEDSQLLRQQLDEWKVRLAYRDFSPFLWPPIEFRSLIALAQHNRVPTRALDWSWSPLVAAYFAVEPLARTRRESGNACVWVFNYTVKEMDDVLADLYPGNRPIVLFTTSGADNVNLRAQQALFMVWQQRVNSTDEPFEAIPYEDLLAQSLPTSDIRNGLFQVTVPATEATHTFAMLAGAGITAGAMFPGLLGVANEFHEQKITRVVSEVPQTETARSIDRAMIKLLESGA